MDHAIKALLAAHNAILGDHAEVLAAARKLIDAGDTEVAEVLMTEAIGMRRAARVVQDLLHAELAK